MADRVTFSGLMVGDDDLSEDDILEKVLQEDAELSGSHHSKKEKKSNVFDWDQDDEDHNMLESFGLFDSAELQDAKQSLMKSKIDENDGKNAIQRAVKFLESEILSSKEGPSITDNLTNKIWSMAPTSVRLRSGSSEARHITSSSPTDKTRTNTESREENFTEKGQDIQKSLSLKHVQNISDVIENEPQISAKEYERVKQELRKCKTTIETLKIDRWKSVPAQEAVKRLILGKPYSLEYYKSLQEKTELLEYALKYHDGNAIMAVVLFLKRTLKPSIFAKQLKRKPEALNHYIRYLEATSEWKELMNLYKQLYRFEEAAILHYHYITKIEEPGNKLREIENWQREHKHTQGLADLFSYVEEDRKVLNLQIQIEQEDLEAEKQGKNVMLRYHPRTATIPLKSLLTTLYYCAMYHFDKPTEIFHPSSIKKDFKLTDKQYEWSVLPARAKLHKWTDVSEILTASGWLRRKSEKSQIGFDRVTEILQRNGAPQDIIEKYIRLIENADTRLKMATSCKCHDVAIDDCPGEMCFKFGFSIMRLLSEKGAFETFAFLLSLVTIIWTIVVMKDKEKLEKYRENVKFDEKFRRRVGNLLIDNTIKWR